MGSSGLGVVETVSGVVGTSRALESSLCTGHLELERAVADVEKAQVSLVDRLEALAESRGGSLHASSELYSRWLISRAHTMGLKLAVLKQQLLKDTYSARTVAALAAIRSHLDKEMDAVRAKYDAAADLTRQYEQAGFGFDKLVEEYAKIQQEIKEKEWALAQLQ